jgi:plastocyanin
MRPIRPAAALAALTFALAACGGGSSSSSGSPPPASGGGSADGGGTPVDVTLADYSISLAGGTALQPGTYTFSVTNTGQTGHNLTVEGPGVDDQATPTFTSGTQQLTVTLSDGTYELYCSVPGHRDLGMEVDVTVGGGGGVGSTEDSGGGSTDSDG